MLQMSEMLSTLIMQKKKNSPPGDSPVGRTYYRLNAEDAPSDQWNVFVFRSDVDHFLGNVGDSIGVKPLLVVA